MLGWQKTLLVIKPDALYRRHVGDVVARLERKGLQLVGMRMLHVDEPLARRMYAVHEGKEFYEPLVRFIQAGPVVAVALAGPDAIAAVRSLVGETYGAQAQPGTIRGDFGLSRRHNLVHASDSSDSVRRELPLFFSEEDLLDWQPADTRWIDPPADGQYD